MFVQGLDGVTKDVSVLCDLKSEAGVVRRRSQLHQILAFTFPELKSFFTSDDLHNLSHIQHGLLIHSCSDLERRFSRIFQLRWESGFNASG